MSQGSFTSASARSPGHLCLLGDANSVHLQRWAAEMQRRGWRVSVVTARPAPIDGVEQLVLPPVSGALDWIARIGPSRRAVAALKPDLLHAHYVTSYGFLAACCNHPRRVMTAWGSDLLVTPRRGWWWRALTAWTLRRARLVTGDSQDLVDVAQQLSPGVPTALIHWGVDLSRFAPAPRQGDAHETVAAAASSASPPPFEAVSLRSWEPNYHVDTILDAFAEVRRRLPGRALHLHLLGGGSLEAELRAQVARLGLADVVSVHGRLDDAGMVSVMRHCRLSISVPASDATSVALLESMACGLAVIASDLPANRDWLELNDDPHVQSRPLEPHLPRRSVQACDARRGGDGGRQSVASAEVTGSPGSARRQSLVPPLLVPAGDVGALAEAWAWLACHDEACASLGARNAERIRREGDRRVQMDEVDRLYRQCLGLPSVTHPIEGGQPLDRTHLPAADVPTDPPPPRHPGRVPWDDAPDRSDAAPTVSIIVPCRNERPYLDAFLDSALSQRLPPGSTLEVVVADGGSDDGSRERLEVRAASDPRLVVIDNPERITSVALNRAIDRARGVFVVRMDVHTVYADDYVAACVAALQRTGATCVGGAWRPAEGRGRQRAIARAFASRLGSGGAASRRVDFDGQVDTVYLGAWRRDELRRLGGFDEQLVRNQDDELALRTQRLGGRVWQSAAIRSWYTPRASFAALYRQFWQYGYWKVAVIRKHGRPASWRHLVPFGFAAVLGLLALAGSWWPPLWGALGASMLAYALVLLGSAALIAPPWREPAQWAGIAWATACMHTGYAAGFARGLLARAGRSPDAAATRLTR